MKSNRDQNTTESEAVMIKRNDEIAQFEKILETSDVSVLNIHGETGIGKSAFVHQLMNEQNFSNKLVGGYIDLGRISTTSDNEMIDILYEICDQLKLICSFKPMDFRIADQIDSKRSKRIPYSERESSFLDSGEVMDMALDVSDIISSVASSFIDLTYLGTGLKAWKIISKIHKKCKDFMQTDRDRYQYYDSMDDKQLRESLPSALAEDLKLSEDKNNRRIILFIDNFKRNHTDLGENRNEWLERLIRESGGNVLWVLISREKLESELSGMAYLEVKRIGDKEILEYLKAHQYDEQIRQRIVSLCHGSPFYMHRILETLREKGSFSDDDWNRLASNERKGIALEYLNYLSSEKREPLYLLSYASAFDSNIFHILFPERIFALNDKWFHSSTFESVPGGLYNVQSTMAEVIHEYLADYNPQIETECYNRLFDAERLLIKHMTAAGNLDLHSHFCCLCQYGRKIKNTIKYYNTLNELKHFLLSQGEAKQYYNELVYLLETIHAESDLKLQLMIDISVLDYYQSDYRKAVVRCQEGRTLARKNGNKMLLLQFIAIEMDIAHIAPSSTSGASDQVIALANEYIALLEQMRIEMPYKTYITNKLKAYLYIAQEYTIKENFDLALQHMTFIFDELNDIRKVNALSLHDLYAKSHEIMGNLYGEAKQHDLEEEMQKKAVEAYNIAEAVQNLWNPEFYLNFGLACKRQGESCLRQGRLDEGIGYMEQALAKYKLVKSKNYEITDTYCKIGFACNDSAKYLISNPAYDEKTHEFLTLAEDTANEAVMMIEDFTGEKTNGNRQLCNIRCTASRLSGVLFARNGQMREAEEAFEKSLTYGLQSIETAPSHPYGYFVHAGASLDYAVYLVAQQRQGEASQIVRKGMEHVEKAREYTDDKNAFSDLYDSLLEIAG